MSEPITMVPVHSIAGHRVFIPSDRASLRVDEAWLGANGACNEGWNWFRATFPEGCTYLDLRAALTRQDWENWIIERTGGDTATAGDMGTATAGDMGTATAGAMGTATAGYRGTATAGYRGVISIHYYDEQADRYKVMIGYIGEGGLKAGVAYRLNDQAQFEEVPNA